MISVVEYVWDKEGTKESEEHKGVEGGMRVL